MTTSVSAGSSSFHASNSSSSSSSSGSRVGRVTNGVYRPLSTSAPNEIELQDRPSVFTNRTISDARSSSTAPSAPAQVSDTGAVNVNMSTAGTSNGQTKYLCCGGCRQWLMSPVDAELVYCPTCHNVNRCPVSLYII